jgi:ABC-2 type transport system ATP-binding protein
VHHATRTETPTNVSWKVSLREEAAIGNVVQAIAHGGDRILSLTKSEPTLEDVFLELVGRKLS